jgi:tRNA pseudouridine32 synthase / 23S rRNA pseudouridine746 synthase
MLNRFTAATSHIEIPEQFPSPFTGEPHPICVLAANEVKAYLEQQTQWCDKLQQGKMFGVLVVKESNGELGYLAAFSGNLEGKNYHPFFVPPVADLLNPNGFFKQGEQVISSINRQIAQMEQSTELTNPKNTLEQAKQKAIEEIAVAKAALKASKVEREERRTMQPSEEEQAFMVRQSQHEKAELKRLEKRWTATINELQAEYDRYAQPIEELRAKRKMLSADLQQRLFDVFQLLNIRGEAKGLVEIFENTAQRVPPGGAGECAGPKLLQYAFANNLTPIAMAEFWWGSSPKTEIRHHGHYYPPCKGKCEPILGHMLQGMDIKYPERKTESPYPPSIEVIYEDEWLLVINKPAGMLSAPGKTGDKSAVELVGELLLNGREAFLVHRLDMATSGLLLIAKDKEVYKQLQSQFEQRRVRKRYIAILDGVLHNETGIIELPLRLNPLDRPRQMVCLQYGKPSTTQYQVLERRNGQTRVAFYPLTGRTHQLRVHAAHPHGLSCPIAGDELYGSKSNRLYLHAEYMEFTHPITSKRICLKKDSIF